MPPIVAIQFLPWAGFHKTEDSSTLNFLRESKSILPIAPAIDKTLYARQDGGPTRGFPVTSNAETTMEPPDPQNTSPIPGLNRSIFIVVIVSGVVVLGLAIFIPVCYWRRRRRNRRRRQNARTREEDLELAGFEENDSPEQLYDAPRPDSTTLPIQGMLMQSPERAFPEMEGAMGSSLEGMLNRFSNGSGVISHRRLGSKDSERSRSTWDNDIWIRMPITPPNWSPSYQDYPRSRTFLSPASPPPALLRSPTIASFNSNPVGTLRSPTITSFISNPRAALHSPMNSSFASNSPRTPTAAKGKQPERLSKSISKASPTKSNKLRKKIRRKSEKAPTPKPIPASPIMTFGGFGRASAGSMSNWTSWWENSSDDEGDSIMQERRQNT